MIDQALARTRAEQQITPAAQVSSSDDSDSDEEKEEEEEAFFRNFTYQVLEDEDIQVQMAQTEPAKRGRPPKNPIARPLVRPTDDDQTIILKRRAQEEADVPAVKNARSGGWKNVITGQPQRLDGSAIPPAPPIVGSQVPEVQMEDEEDLDDDRVDEPTPVQPRRRVKFVDSTGKERIIGDANTEPDGPKPKNVTPHNMIKKAAKENPHAVIEKFLWTVKYLVQGRELFRRGSKNVPLRRVVDDADDQITIIQYQHDNAGHSGVESTLKRVANI